MNRTFLIIFISVVTLIGGFIAFITAASGNGTNIVDEEALRQDTALQAKVVKDACGVLTPNLAREVLGGNITTDAENPVTTEDQQIFLSICHYKSAEKLATGIQLHVRSAKNQQGLNMNLNQFSSTRPTSAQSVNDLGDRAYYVTELKQLHILKDSSWYILSIYSESDENAGSLEKERALAEKMDLK